MDENYPVLLIVRSEPIHSTFEGRYHNWYESHVKQLVRVPGVRSARRFESVDGEMRFMAMYEIESLRVMATSAYKEVGRFEPIASEVQFTRNVYREIPLSGPT